MRFTYERRLTVDIMLQHDSVFSEFSTPFVHVYIYTKNPKEIKEMYGLHLYLYNFNFEKEKFRENILVG